MGHKDAVAFSYDAPIILLGRFRYADSSLPYLILSLISLLALVVFLFAPRGP